jgi:hypothetical protein
MCTTWKWQWNKRGKSNKDDNKLELSETTAGAATDAGLNF